MRMRVVGMLAGLVGVLLWAAYAQAGDKQKKGANGDRKKAAGTKVELKDLPQTVTDAAKREAPGATFTAATKIDTKKKGAIFHLTGTDGKKHVSVAITSSGEVLKKTENTHGKGKKKGKKK